MRFRFSVFGLVLAILFLSWGLAGAEPDEVISTASLFQEMVDLEKLTRFPAPAYTTVQFSSYDRRSDLPEGPGWFANSDGFGGEPVPNFEKILKPPGTDGVGEYLIADVKGPGAIVRLWTAAIAGRIRAFIDGSKRPFYDGEAVSFFHRIYDHFPEVENLDRTFLERTVYQRDAAYAPIPFQNSLRIVWIGNIKDIHFYQVGVRLYEVGTEVQSFYPRDLVEEKDKINAVLAVLADPDRNRRESSFENEACFFSSLPPQEKRVLLSLDGPGAIHNLTLKLQAEDTREALRKTILHIHFDGYPQGQVQSPVGDFFGAAPGINPYQSLPFSVFPDGTQVSRFVMPFKKTCQIVLENQSDQPVNITGSVRSEPYVWDDGRSMHFRARWRIDHELVASNKDVQDLPFLVASGSGVYVGTTSYLMNPCPVPTPNGNWWGEGDEKVFIDGEDNPSTFGTGSEDYYNYSWSSPDIFFFPYCGQPRNDGPGNRGFVTNFRWHILDPLPFRSGLAFFMELYHHERTPGLSYGRIGYHYARPGLKDDLLPIKPSDVRTLEIPLWAPEGRRGARNAVFFEAETLLGDPSSTYLRGGRLFSNKGALIWSPDKPGTVKDFLWNVDEAGNYRIRSTLVLDKTSGSVSALVDGSPVPWIGDVESVSLHRPHRTLLRTFDLPVMALSAGEHTLTLKFEGAGPSVGNPSIGIDFIWIQRIER